jgi:hypothetical protein
MSTLQQVIEYDVIANRPVAGIPGRLFYATDRGLLYRDNGSTWQLYTGFLGSGPTSTRPIVDSGAIGVRYFDTSLGFNIWWSGLHWVRWDGTTV